MDYRRELPTPSVEEKMSTPSPHPRQDDVTSFLEDLSRRMKSGEEVNPEDIAKFQTLMQNSRSNPQQVERMRNALQGDEMVDKMVKKVSKKTNAHGQQQPSRKKAMQAQKSAKKAMSVATLASRGKKIKAVLITKSRQVKNVSLTTGKELEDVGNMFHKNVNACMWGDLVVVYIPEQGHIRNKLIEKFFSRDAMFGPEVVVFRHDIDTLEKDLNVLSKGAKSPSVYEPPTVEEEPIEEESKEGETKEEKTVFFTADGVSTGICGSQIENGVEGQNEPSPVEFDDSTEEEDLERAEMEALKFVTSQQSSHSEQGDPIAIITDVRE